MDEEVRPTVFVVDDDQAVRQSLEMLLRSVGMSAATFASAEEFLEAYDSNAPGCLVLDVRMPGTSGLELQKKLKDRGCLIPVIVITGHGDVPVAVSAMKEGALDFIQKPFSKQLLLERIKDALAEDVRLREQNANQRRIESRVGSLTAREKEVMQLVAAGLSNKQMAVRLGVSQKTVEVHRAHVMHKMQVDSLAQLVEQVVTARMQLKPGPEHRITMQS